MYGLRRATLDDFDFVFNLNRRVYHDYIIKLWGGWDEEFQRAFCQERLMEHELHIISYDGRDIGVLELIRKEGQIYLEEIQLQPESQGKGLGTEIIRGILLEAFAMDCSVGLIVLKVNERARKLYEKLGFVKTGETDTHDVMEAHKEDKKLNGMLEEVISKIQETIRDKSKQSFGTLEYFLPQVVAARNERVYLRKGWFLNHPRWLGEYRNTPEEEEICGCISEIELYVSEKYHGGWGNNL